MKAIATVSAVILLAAFAAADNSCCKCDGSGSANANASTAARVEAAFANLLAARIGQTLKQINQTSSQASALAGSLQKLLDDAANRGQALGTNGLAQVLTTIGNSPNNASQIAQEIANGLNNFANNGGTNMNATLRAAINASGAAGADAERIFNEVRKMLVEAENKKNGAAVDAAKQAAQVFQDLANQGEADAKRIARQVGGTLTSAETGINALMNASPNDIMNSLTNSGPANTAQTAVAGLVGSLVSTATQLASGMGSAVDAAGQAAGQLASGAGSAIDAGAQILGDLMNNVVGGASGSGSGSASASGNAGASINLGPISFGWGRR